MPNAALNSWNPADMELPPSEPVVPRERIFPRKVLIGWALFALAAYFGVHLIGSVIKSSVREAINTATIEAGGAGGNLPGKEIIYQTPNGKITITRDRRGGPITIIRRNPTRAHPDGPPDPAEAAAEAKAAAQAAVDAAEAAAKPQAASKSGSATPLPKR
jgi:hypothetical protein